MRSPIIHTSFGIVGCIFELIVALVRLRLLLLAQGHPLVRLESVSLANDHLHRTPSLMKDPSQYIPESPALPG